MYGRVNSLRAMQLRRKPVCLAGYWRIVFWPILRTTIGTTVFRRCDCAIGCSRGRRTRVCTPWCGLWEWSGSTRHPHLRLFFVTAPPPPIGEIPTTPPLPPPTRRPRGAGPGIGYHEREEKSFWWAHFFRAEQPMELWEEQRNVIIVDPAASRVRQGWVATDHRRVERRLVELRGRVALGSRFSVGAQLMVLYEPPAPCPQPDLVPGSRMSHRIIVREVLLDGLLVEETAINAVTWNELPSAVVPGPPPPAGRQRGAIEEWAAEIVSVNEGGPVADDGTALAPIWPKNAVIDILRRMPPRTRDGCLIITTQDDPIVAITEAILRLDSSYLAVQGPPGTGKTYCGSHVIAALVREHHMKIGVVAQSHAVIENLLGAVVAAGVPPELVGKVPKDASPTAATAAPVPSPVFRALAKNQHARFTAEQAESGFVLGGTAWDFANAGRVARGLLDLLVIDEAGQFSLASTIAAGVSARNLLLLGDPQQLPQVSQNSHPEPIDESVLGWVAQDHDVLPPGFGVFLAESRR